MPRRRRGATWWEGLPPCYEANHEGPPLGSVSNERTMWEWSDGPTILIFWVERPGSVVQDGQVVPFGTIMADKNLYPDATTSCPRA
jgi:hypothetical protein